MKLLALATGTALLVAACGGGAQPAPATAKPAATSAAPAAATTVTFKADLKSTNEVPPISNDEKSGTGTATVTFDLTRSAAGAITAAKAKFDVVLSGFPTTTAITLGHIHKGAAGANGGVSVGFKTDAPNPINLTTGGTTIAKADITVDPALAQQIIDDPAGYYVNIHSATNPGGVVRGQLTKQ
jgi:CHRD domain-containing protein